MRYRSITLTDEQAIAAKAIISGQSIKLQAPAGSGKTATLCAGARKLPGYGLNISFNKSIAIAAAKKFPSHCLCKTSHSLAFSSIGWKYKNRLTKLTGRKLSETHNLGKISHFRSPAIKGYYILETIRNYCYSSSPHITTSHTPTLPITVKDPSILTALSQDLTHHSQEIWSLMANQSETIPITHDVYLKLWALTKPNLAKDYILFDEAQDANPVIIDVITNQIKLNSSQIVFVGDALQQIYSWRGAVNALSTIDLTPYHITKSFRFGQPIADIANAIISSYSDPSNRIPAITGNDQITSTIDTTYSNIPDCLICRTNATVIRLTMEYLARDYRIHILGGVINLISLITGIKQLANNQKSNHPELMLFNSWSDLLEYVESPMGGDLKYLVKLIDKYGFTKIITTLKSTTPTPSDATITITTAHKSKGLEWPIVKLANDFPYPYLDENNNNIIIPSQEETNILYVAATRALNILDITHCDALRQSNLQKGQEYWNEQEKLKKLKSSTENILQNG